MNIFASATDRTLADAETNDCSVLAIAHVCGIPYSEAHLLAQQFGRDDRKAMYQKDICRAIRGKGWNVSRRYLVSFKRCYPRKVENVTTYHPKRFPEVWDNGRKYIAFTDGHVLAIVDGAALDWTADRSIRVKEIYEVWK